MFSTVSVIMGVYNSEATLNRAIDSIINQTFDDWKFIICDDGSSDSSLSILMEYKRDYPDRFIIIQNNQNKGLTYSLNECLKYADSQYIARMDSDDISLPKRLELQVQFLDNHPDIDFVSCGIERFDEMGVWKACKVKNNYPHKEDFLWSSVFVHPTVLIRRDILNSIGGYRDTWFTSRCEDYDLWMRLYAAGHVGYVLNQILFQYYEGRESFSKRKYRYRICEAYTRMLGYYHLHLYPKGIIFIFKPLVVGLLPSRLIKDIHKVQ